MTNEQKLKTLFPRASRDFIDLNAGLRAEEPKSDFGQALVGKASGEAKGDARIVLGFILYRIKLLDPDNAVASLKSLVDCLREVGLIPDDSEQDIKIEVEQEKVNHFSEQKTELHIKYP